MHEDPDKSLLSAPCTAGNLDASIFSLDGSPRPEGAHEPQDWGHIPSQSIVQIRNVDHKPFMSHLVLKGFQASDFQQGVLGVLGLGSLTERVWGHLTTVDDRNPT